MVSYVRGRNTRTMTDEAIVEAYAAGEDSTSVGHRAGCDANTVLYLVRRSGGTVRPRGTRPRLKVLPLTDAEVVQSYREGLSAPVIADRCGVSAATIYTILEKSGCPRRPAASTATAAAAVSRAKRKRKP